MCHPNKGLHNNENVIEIETDLTLKDIISDRPNEAELFFLMNEDVLH